MDEMREKIRAEAKQAAAEVAQMQPFKPDMPCTMRIAFRDPEVSIAAELVPGVERVSPESVQFDAPDAISALRLTRLMLHLTR